MRPTMKDLDELETRAGHAEALLAVEKKKVQELEWEVLALKQRQESLLYAQQLMHQQLKAVQRRFTSQEWMALAK